MATINIIGTIVRLFPSFKGKLRLVNILLGKNRQTARDIHIKNSIQITLPNLVEASAFEYYTNGYYESETITILSKLATPGSIVLDIGANIGLITLSLAEKRKDLTLISIEASPFVYPYLCKNVASNPSLHSRIHLINQAMHEKDGMELSFYAPEDKIGCGSFSAIFTQTAVTLETITIDTIIEREKLFDVNLIKIDIEGYEYYALKGAKGLLLSEQAPDILFEFVDWAEGQATGLSPGACQQLLVEFGYKLYQLSKRGTLIPLSSIQTTGAK